MAKARRRKCSSKKKAKAKPCCKRVKGRVICFGWKKIKGKMRYVIKSNKKAAKKRSRRK